MSGTDSLYHGPHSRRRALVLLWGLLWLVLAVRAVPVIVDQARQFSAPGPNTVGEAGKVYFAHRVQVGESPFQSGQVPPYYPSVHGALLHASVGAVGRVLDSSVTELYTVGRVASLLLTLGALIFLGLIGVRAGLPPAMLLTGLAVWCGTLSLIQHTASYRPDNWLLFSSAWTCWLLVTRPDRGTSLLLLALLPPIAFHVKATGLLLGAMIGVVHLLRGQWARAAVLGLVQVALVSASVLLLDAASDGAYLEGLAGIGSVGWSAWYPMRALLLAADPIHTVAILGPLVFAPWLLRGVEHRETVAVVATFWAIGLAGGCLSALRAGSATYYFLEPGSYGLILTFLVLHHLSGSDQRRGGFPIRPAIVFLGLIALGLPSALRNQRAGLASPTRLRTEELADSRSPLADRINRAGWTCYSDDPGLNVLLDRPAVIYPVLQLQMIDQGALPSSTLTGPVLDQSHDCLVSSRSLPAEIRPAAPSDGFWEVATERYPRGEAFGPYRIYTQAQVRLP